MDFHVIWADSAILNLQEVCTFIALDDPAAAQRVGQGILDHVKILGSFPYIGPPYPRRSAGTVREIVYRNYRIFYQVNQDTRSVEILHVWHGARGEPPLAPDWPTH